MPLTLRVSSYQGHAMGSNATCVFEGAGTIGRAPGNDWILPDPDQIVSGRHASISLEGGQYVLTDLGSTNGTVVNGREIPKGGRVTLNHGDTITIGNYDLAVAVSHGAAALGSGAWRPEAGQSFMGGASARPIDSDPFDGTSGGAVDPLAFFTDPGASLNAQPPPASIPDHSSPEREFFVAPQVTHAPQARTPAPEPAPRSAEVIPDNWYDSEEEEPDSFAPAFAQQVEPTWEDAGWTEPAVPAAPTQPPQAPPGTPPPAAVPQPTGASGSWGGLRGDTGRMPAAGSGGTGPAPAARPANVDALFRAAGIDPAMIDEAALASLGEILRVVVDGVMDVLRARAEIKNQFRVAMTTLKPVENNPLKFSASVEDALFNLFARRNPSYQAPVDAFREAFADLKAHQFAVMAGMRSAFSALLQRFDPDELEDSFDRGLKRAAILDVINKTKYWELYREMYAELGNDDATFRRLFGDEFAQAYEEQMQRLAAAVKSQR